jgi:hypothetical protein
MASFPFDSDTVPYAYITARVENNYAHLRVMLRNLPGLTRNWSDGAPLVMFSNQAGGEHRATDPEPFYAWRLGAVPDLSDGLSVTQCEAAAKALRALHKRLDKIDELAGAPAQLVEDYIIRLLRAARVEHVYCEERPHFNGGSYTSGGIPDWPCFAPAEFGRLHSHLRGLKRQMAERVCIVPRAAA